MNDRENGNHVHAANKLRLFLNLLLPSNKISGDVKITFLLSQINFPIDFKEKGPYPTQLGKGTHTYISIKTNKHVYKRIQNKDTIQRQRRNPHNKIIQYKMEYERIPKKQRTL